MKSIEQIIDDQVKRWERVRSEEEKSKKDKYVVTFSREPGSGGSIIAPLEIRIQNVSRNFNVPQDEAKRRVLKTESDRRAFVRKYFYEDVAAAVNYDLIINTQKLNIEAAVAAIRGALGKII